MDPAAEVCNESLYSMLEASVAGRARTRLTTSMRQHLEDTELLPHTSDDATSESDGGTPWTSEMKKERQVRFMTRSSYLAWQTLSQHDEADADKWLDKLSAARCTDLTKVPQHLDRMEDLFDKYSNSVPDERLQHEQPMLSDKLTDSLPDVFITNIGSAFRGKPRKSRTWTKTMSIARDVYEEQAKIAQRCWTLRPGMEM
jgi:hypothetical protein